MVASGAVASHKATPMVMDCSAEASTALRAMMARVSAALSGVGTSGAALRIAGSTSRR